MNDAFYPYKDQHKNNLTYTRIKNTPTMANILQTKRSWLFPTKSVLSDLIGIQAG
jgi:hypothetical protein